MNRVQDVRWADPAAVKESVHRALSKSRALPPEVSDGLVDLIYSLGYVIVEDTNADSRLRH